MYLSLTSIFFCWIDIPKKKLIKLLYICVALYKLLKIMTLYTLLTLGGGKPFCIFM